MFSELREFHSSHGHCDVPSTMKQLKQWTVRQRYLHRSDSQFLSHERIKLLNSLDFRWGTRSETLWSERTADLRAFRVRHGHVMVPRNYSRFADAEDAEGRARCEALSSWVSTQRKNYMRKQKGLKSPLTDERIRELEGMGFVWSYWDYKFSEDDEKWSDAGF